MHTIYSWWKTQAVRAVEANMTVMVERILHIQPRLTQFEQASGSLNFHSICSETFSDPPYSDEKEKN